MSEFEDDPPPPIRAGPANHFKGIEAVGGRLWLTDSHLCFRSHGVNFQIHTQSFPLESIRSVKPCRTLWILPNGLLVTLNDGVRHRFVVGRRREWATDVEFARRRRLEALDAKASSAAR